MLVLSGLGVLFLVLRPEKPGGPAAQTPERTIELAIEDGAMNPVEIGEGDRVRLRITTQGTTTEVHLHGYELQREVAPGEPTTLSFDADLTRRFEIEDHGSEEVSGMLLAQPR